MEALQKAKTEAARARSRYPGLRGYRGKADSSSYFTTADKWGAYQGFERPRSPLYMREWQTAWRDLDAALDPTPRAGERVFDEFLAMQGGYPTDHLDPSRLLSSRRPCELPETMRYWRDDPSTARNDVDAVASGRVPELRGTKYLTFVPDLGGWNNVRLSFENVLVLARSTGRTLVLPPPQTYYLLTACKRNCVFSMEQFLPALLDVPNLVITAKELMEVHLPRVRKQNRLHKPARYQKAAGDRAVRWPPPDNVTRFVDGCTPTHVSPDSCFPLYFWLEETFGLPDVVPDVGQQCIIWKSKDDGLDASAHAKKIHDFCASRTHLNGHLGATRTVVDGAATWGTDDAILHVRSSGVATHNHHLWKAKKPGEKQLEPARMGRFLAPWYTVQSHLDPAAANFYHRLVRDVVRLDEPRVARGAAHHTRAS